jgi:hypothetical protein
MAGPAPPGGLRQSLVAHVGAGLPRAREACSDTCGADTPMRVSGENIGRGMRRPGRSLARIITMFCALLVLV